MRFLFLCKLCLTLKIALSQNTHWGDKVDACARQSALPRQPLKGRPGPCVDFLWHIEPPRHYFKPNWMPSYQQRSLIESTNGHAPFSWISFWSATYYREALRHPQAVSEQIYWWGSNTLSCWINVIEVHLICKGCLGRWFMLIGIHINAHLSGFPSAIFYCSGWSVLFTLTRCNVVAGPCTQVQLELYCAWRKICFAAIKH